ncbi:helix-turn-helix domain-containing protein [Paratissierella segnis]|uniref:helix-turn-helix domain-containing protein n=1 Tax=Paratissierella segnis TaxID=2763679 RepID=UPI00223BAB6F|nr:helix-turn-helix domain-containing protein [Paratissierella segnis]
MTISKAVAKRILNLCEEREISINKLANLSAITQSTLNSIINGESKNLLWFRY